MKQASELSLAPDQVLGISRALADPRRFAIFQQIAGQPVLLCTALDARTLLSPATISHHLKELQGAGLITAEREGRGVKLALRRDVWEAYLRTLIAVAETKTSSAT